MKQACVGFLVASAVVAAGHQVVLRAGEQSMMAADHAAVEKAITANEPKIDQAFAKRDVAGMKMFVADDAVSVDATGVMTAADLFKQLPTMDIKETDQNMSNFKFTWIDATTVVVSYTWTGKGTFMGQPIPSPTYSSTVWAKRGAKWMAVYHQETVAAAMPANAPMKK